MIRNKAYTLEQLKARVTASKWSQELIDELEAEEQAAAAKETERIDKRNEWYENCVGKCFLIDFNGVSFAAFRIDRSPAFSDKMEGVRICVSRPGSDTGSRIEYDKKDAFNRFWLQNPYEDNGVYGGSGIRGVKEITNEKFNELVATCDKVTEILENAIK